MRVKSNISQLTSDPDIKPPPHAQPTGVRGWISQKWLWWKNQVQLDGSLTSHRKVIIGGGAVILLITWLLQPWLYNGFCNQVLPIISGVTGSVLSCDFGFSGSARGPIIQKPLIIAVMGMTGVGKSTFIRELTKDANITIGNDLTSCTDAIQYSSLSFQVETGLTYNVILADTPGFDDSRSGRTDLSILEDIADWLEDMYDSETKLTGIVYLYRITDDRLAGTSARNLRMMRDLVGEDNMKNVMLVTTRWEIAAHSADELAKAEHRENQLRNNTDGNAGFWYDLITTYGAAYARHDGSYSSAKSILSRIVQNSPVYIQLQGELAKGVHILDTTAGNAVLSIMEKEGLLQMKRMDKLEKEMKAQAEERNKLMKEMNEELKQIKLRQLDNESRESREEYEKLKEKVRIMQEELERLRKRLNRRGKFARFGEKVDNFFSSGDKEKSEKDN